MLIYYVSMLRTIEIPRLKCLRCGHEWTPRKPEVIVCPKCKSPRWNKPRRKDIEKEQEAQE